MLLEIPRSIELRPEEIGSESDPISPSSLLHGWICSSDLPWLSAVHLPHRPRADPANVGRQEHDVRRRPPPRPLPDSLCNVQRKNEHQRSRRTDDQCTEQKLIILRGMDSQQREIKRL